MSYDRFVDDRLLTSRDVLNRKQIKIKLVDYDEPARDFSQRFGSSTWVLLAVRPLPLCSGCRQTWGCVQGRR